MNRSFYASITRYLTENKIIWGIALIMAFIQALVISYCGKIQFAGYDGSILVNHAWQLYLGYKPYQEIITGWPPILLIGCQIAFNIWGVTWKALVYITAFFSTVTFIFQIVILLRVGFRPIIAIALSTAIQSMTMILISWWWYNQITAVVVCLFISTTLLLFQSPASKLNRFLFVITTTALLLCKPNIASITLILFAGMLLLAVRHYRFQVLILLGVSALTAGFILVLSDIDPIELILSYRHYAVNAFTMDRILKFIFINDSQEVKRTFSSLIPGALATIISMESLRKRKAHQRMDSWFYASGILAVAIGLWAMMTNNDLNLTDAVFILFGMSIIVFLPTTSIPHQNLRIGVQFLTSVSIILLSINSLQYSFLRYRVQTAGDGYFFENAQLTRLSSPDLFQDVLVGPRMVRVIDTMTDILQEMGYLGQADAPVFFGPRIDFGYAAYGIHPHRSLPTWWEFYSQDGTGQTDIMVERFKKADILVCIFLNSDNPYISHPFLPQGLVNHLEQYYSRSTRGDLVVFVKK